MATGPPVAPAYNLTNCLRQLVLPEPIRCWTLPTPREKRIKIGAKVVRHARSVTFQLAEVAVPRTLSAALLRRIGRLRLAGATGRGMPPPDKRSEGSSPGVRGAPGGACPLSPRRRRD